MVPLLIPLILLHRASSTLAKEGASFASVSRTARLQCNFLEDPLASSEGDGEREGLRLKGLVYVSRHGDRLPLRSPLPTKPGFNGEASGEVEGDCSAFTAEQRHEFAEYQKVVASASFKHFLHLDPLYASFKLIPHASTCSLGNMTAEGALQILRVAKRVAKKYSKTSLFKGKKIETTVQSTMFPRTFQTMIAYASALFYPQRKTIPKLHLKASPHIAFCNEAECACNKSFAQIALRPVCDEEYLKAFEELSSREFKLEVNQTVDALEMPDLKEPLTIIDVLLGNYICRRKSLPCSRKGVCATYKTFDALINSATARNDKLVKDKKSVVPRSAAADSRVILLQLLKVAEALRKSPQTHQIRANFGHDTTLLPLLRALGLHTLIPTPYAARLALEVYSRDSLPKAQFVRVVFEGKDRTADVRFCPRASLVSGLCPAELFAEFVNKGIFQFAGVKDRKELCDP